MAGEFFVTIGDVSNLPGLFTGPYLKGRNQPRVAMVGRSNVGKSSLINALLERPLAQTSNQPGKTRAIHFYFWPEAKKIVADLPGYGYARAGHEERDRWSRFIGAYLKEDQNINRALVLLDARHGPTDLDVEAIKFLSDRARVPMTFVFTKFDQLKTQADRARRKKEAIAALVALGIENPPVYWVSVKSKDGLKPLLNELTAP